jgi:hypothetical protein
VTNKSADTVSVKLPKAVAAVHVLKQFGFPGAGVGGNNAGAGLGQGQGNGVGGQGQSVGGGMNGGARNANGQAFGQGIFSVPSNKTVQLPLKTVCLAHGQPEPQPRMTYKLVPIEDFTSNTTLHEVLKLFVSGEADQQTAQAAAWHLASGMTWEQLKAKKIDHLGGLQSTPFFTAKQVKAAEELVERAKKRVDAAAAEKPETTREERPATVSAR